MSAHAVTHARWRWAAVVGTAALILAVPPPDGITMKSWELLAIFAATIVGSIARPVAAGAVVFLGVCAIALFNVLPPKEALGGYADPIVWLVLCAFFMSRGVLKTGLGRRIAFLFIRAIGKSSLGLSYALISTDTLLAAFVPSNGARAGGVIYPVATSLAEAYESHPGETARRLGAFLLFAIYQGDVIACSMWWTGQASNALIAKFTATATNIDFTYGKWILGAVVPGLVLLALMPLVLYRLFPPEIKHTPAAAQIAHDELARLGPMKRDERLMLAAFLLVAGLWMTTALHHINYAVVALLGISSLFLTKVLTWDDIIGERAAWDVFIWYGGLVRMAEALGDTGITRKFAEYAASMTVGWTWGAALAVLVLIYFYAHYGFASITAHATAMFTPFLVVVMAAGAPTMLAVALLAYTSNLSAGLTHYGTTPAPIYFGSHYITQRDWWLYGLILSVLGIAVYGTVGLAWWKVLGWW
ncbi:MAG: DASS family sodium-coupled anion symporter [Gemmatimonadaceae bacterium]|nr:DASS family sodium-coupled anion symporter [Gemmatimonadaceae bacterium]